MSAEIAFQQMLVILILILTGWLCRKARIINDENNKCLSKLMLDVFNPAILISSMLDNKIEDRHSVLAAIGGAALFFAITIFLAMAVVRLIVRKTQDREIYQLMLTFSNLGFIGIPVISALLGKDYLVYVAIYSFEYNILIYTYGIGLIAPDNKKENGTGSRLRGIMNIGTMASALAVVLFLLNIRLPGVLSTAVSYLGDAAVPVSLMIIGVNLGGASFLEIFRSKQNYLFCLFKLLLIPVLEIWILKRLPFDEGFKEASAIILAMPAGTMPLILAMEYGRETRFCSEGIILSTMLSVVTIPAVIWLYPLL